MKKVLFFLVSLLLVAGLTACGSDSKTTSAKSSDDKASEETTSETTSSKEQATEETAAEDAEDDTPSADEIYAYGLSQDLPAITEDNLELDQVSYDFIVKNHTLFPAKTPEAVQKAKQMTDSSVNYKLLNKNAAPYFEKVVSFEGTVISVEEQNLDNNEVVSLTHLMDDEGNSYQVIMYNSTGDLLEEDQARFWGLPLGASSFENVSGGTTNVQVFFGSAIEKVQ
ncbi:hypothetical protein [Neobacillus sp. Marseille-QA0830]